MYLHAKSVQYAIKNPYTILKKIMYTMALHTNRLALRVACLALQGYNDAFFHRPVHKATRPEYKIIKKKKEKKILQYHALGEVK